MSEIIAETHVSKENGWMYYLDKNGDVGRFNTRSPGQKETVARVGVRKEPGYLYFISKDGNVGRAKLKNGGGRKSAE